MFSGVIYAHPPTRARDASDLSRDQLRQMCPKLVGLPVRLEHDEEAPVGTVKASRVDEQTGSVAVDFDLTSDFAKQLVGTGVTPDLSLRHDVFPLTGDRVPVEISLTREGARPNTKIYMGQERARRKPDTAAMEDQPEAKKQKTSEEQVTATEKVTEPAAAAPLSHSEFLARAMTQITDDEMSKELANRFGEIAKQANTSTEKARAAQEELEKLRQENDFLSKRVDSEAKKSEREAKKISEGLSAMRKLLAPEMVDEEDELLNTKVTSAVQSDPYLRAFLSGIPVMCSRVKSLQEGSTRYASALKRVNELEGTLSDLGASEPAPAPAPASYAAPPPVASASAAAPSEPVVPAWLDAQLKALTSSGLQPTIAARDVFSSVASQHAMLRK